MKKAKISKSKKPAALIDAADILPVLVKVRKRISDPKHWTFLTAARDHTGHWVDPNSPHAVCWCVDGAVSAETPGKNRNLYRAVTGALDKVAKVAGYTNVTDLNDDSSQDHASVLVFLDGVIENLEAAA